jgi:hypothetical protein
MNKKNKKVAAQTVYDLQNLGLFSGNDMHDFFIEAVGVASPKGMVEIDIEKFKDFIASCLIAMHLNSESVFIQTLMNRKVRQIFDELEMEKMHSKAFKASVRISPINVYPDVGQRKEIILGGKKYYTEEHHPIFDAKWYKNRERWI